MTQYVTKKDSFLQLTHFEIVAELSWGNDSA